ncbi:uncharacterized protein LOC121949128 [Plectropomus leopardus]|uniref:uncharacterized protein LOC121949128 n=1 Tax=Plectropomus leopardus TaxID=160734 RepID=UPI001C4BD88A|nr:uncharacterized protein LOC121949128 [Plectropomus leopardus]
MTVASFSTAHYLYRHIRSVAQSDCCFSNPRIQSQIRVTITGISQGVLFFLYATFYLFSSVSHLFSLPFFLGGWSSCTISSLYILGTTVNLGIAFVMVFSMLQAEKQQVTQVSYVVTLCSLSTSMKSSVWLNFFYYNQIVPAQRALFVWIKKNIKSIIYCIWFVERIYSVFDLTAMILHTTPSDGFGLSDNVTADHDVSTRAFSKWLLDMHIIVVSVLRSHFILCLCVMVFSSGSTVVYLFKHMRRMVANGQSLSGPRFSGQVRVTVTGILQGVLYVFSSLWIMSLLYSLTSFIDPYTHFTVINMYMSGTTFNLGAGQAVFRQRAADIWLRADRCCKAPPVQQSEQRG